MKKRHALKFIYILLVIGMVIVFAAAFIIISSPHNYADIFYKSKEKISYCEDEILVALEAYEVQKIKDCTYYIDGNHELHRMREESDEILVKDVGDFIIDDSEIYYTHLEKTGIYCRKIESEAERRVLKEDVSIFAIGKDINVVYTDEEDITLCTYNKNWEKLNELDIEREYGDILFRKAVYADKHIVFETYENSLYTYSIEENKMTILDTPMSTDDNYEIISDIVKTEEGIYYMTGAYIGSELYMNTSRERIERKGNGIYLISVREGKFKKVSDNCGLQLVYLDNDIYVLQRGFLGVVFLEECCKK